MDKEEEDNVLPFCFNLSKASEDLEDALAWQDEIKDVQVDYIAYDEVYAAADEEYLFESINDLCVELSQSAFDSSAYTGEVDKTEGRQLAINVIDAMKAAGLAHIDLGDEIKYVIDELKGWS